MKAERRAPSPVHLDRSMPAPSLPSTTSAARSRRCCPSCCGWTRCAAARASSRCWRVDFVAVFARDLHRARAQGRRPRRLRPQRGRRPDDATSSRSSTSSRCCCSPASDLYARRSARPGLTRIVASLFQVTLVALGFALVNGERVLELLHLLRLARPSPSLYVGGLRFLYDRATGLDPPRRRLPAPRACSSGPASTSRPSPTRSTASTRRSTSSASSRSRRAPTTGCARSARSRTSAASSSATASTR